MGEEEEQAYKGKEVRVEEENFHSSVFFFFCTNSVPPLPPPPLYTPAMQAI